MSKSIANVSLGYEKGGFSGRVSAIYQSDILTSVGTISRDDYYQKGFIRYDAIARYNIWENLTVYGEITNLNNMMEVNYRYDPKYATNEYQYKWNLNLGIKYDL
jgi:hypothetical protein